jgi:hypothetical protein
VRVSLVRYEQAPDVQIEPSAPVSRGFRRNEHVGGHHILHITTPDYSKIQFKESTSRMTPNTSSKDKKRSLSMPKTETTGERMQHAWILMVR